MVLHESDKTCAHFDAAFFFGHLCWPRYYFFKLGEFDSYRYPNGISVRDIILDLWHATG